MTPATMEKELEIVKSQGAQGEFIALSLRIGLALSTGRMKEARQLATKCEDMARGMNFKETAVALRSQMALWEAVLGFRQQAVDTANQALKESSSEAAVSNAAFALALSGQEERGS